MASKLRRIRPGYYQYTVDGKAFVIARVEAEGDVSEHWNCCEQNGPDAFHHGGPFDAAPTLKEARHWCEVAAEARA